MHTQRPHHPIRAVAMLALAALFAPAATPKDTDLKAETFMTRPDGAPDSNAKGRIRVEHDTKDGRSKMDVEVENIDTSLTFEVWVEDAGGSLAFVSNMTFNGPGEVEADYDTEEGLPLPFNANDVMSLANRDVEVRSGGQTYLVGSVPALNGAGGGGGGGSGGSGGGGGDWVTLKSSLIRPAGAPDANASGYVEVRKRAKDNNQKFKVEIEHVDPAGSYVLFLEDAAGSGNYVQAGALPADDKLGEFEIELETEDGEALPLGVADVADLGGRGLQVKDGTDAVLLTGVVPTLGTPTKAQTQTAPLVGAVATGKLRVKSWPKKASERFQIEAKKLTKGVQVDIFVFDPQAGAYVFYATKTIGKSGKLKLRADTKKGQALPLDAATVKALAGLSVEIRETGTGVVLASGVVPTL